MLWLEWAIGLALELGNSLRECLVTLALLFATILFLKIMLILSLKARMIERNVIC